MKKFGILAKTNTYGNDGNNLQEEDIESYAFTNQIINDDLIELSIKGKIDFTSIDKDVTKYCVTYCPCNFETMNLQDQLTKTNYSPKKKTLFVMEGLTQYVEKDAMAKTIQTIHQLCDVTGSKILISYVDSRTYNDEKRIELCSDEKGAKQLEGILDIVRTKKEPWITGFHVDEENEKFEMKDWISQNTNGSFCKDYIDQSWDEFCKNDLIPKGRHLYEFGEHVGEPIGKWAVERHACISRRWAKKS